MIARFFVGASPRKTSQTNSRYECDVRTRFFEKEGRSAKPFEVQMRPRFQKKTSHVKLPRKQENERASQKDGSSSSSCMSSSDLRLLLLLQATVSLLVKDRMAETTTTTRLLLLLFSFMMMLITGDNNGIHSYLGFPTSSCRAWNERVRLARSE